MMKKRWKNPAEIRVGVIGYGGAFNMGKAHLNEMRAAGMTPAAVADAGAVGIMFTVATRFYGTGQFLQLKRMLTYGGRRAAIATAK
jgi:hypothetical protein